MTFTDYQPAPRYPPVTTPWTTVRIEEAASSAGPWTQIDEFALDPVDSDPTQPQSRSFTTTQATLPDGWYQVTFLDAAGGQDVTSPVQEHAAGTYTTAANVRSELDVDATALSDTAALRLIRTAESLIDQQLGSRWVDETTGRKVVQADVDDWRWQKLTDATTVLAARLYEHPELLEQQYTSLSGPDFSRSGPIGPRLITPEIDALLNSSGLRRMGGRARNSIAFRGWRGVLQDDGTWDDEPAWSASDSGLFG